MSQRSLQFAIESAFYEAIARKHQYVTVEHLLFALLFEPVARDALAGCGADVDDLRDNLEEFFQQYVPTYPEGHDDKPQQSLGFRRVLERALIHIQSAEKPSLDGGDVLVAIFGETDCHARWFVEQQGISRLDLVQYLSHGPDDDADASNFNGNTGDDTDAESDDTDDNGESTAERSQRTYASATRTKTSTKRKALEQFCANLTGLARDGALDPLVGRHAELERMMQVLCRRRKNNPVLVGNSGVGKTAIVEGFAQLIAEGNVPDILADAELYALDLGSLLAGTKFRGQFEERFKQTIKELQNKKNPILFIDEMHMIMGAGSASGSSMDVSNLLKPVLQQGTIRCVGATTYEDYRQSIERDRALVRRIHKVNIDAPSVSDTVEILRGIKAKYEQYHEVTYDDDAIEAAATLADRYITERFLPDKAIDVIDQAGAANRMLSPELRHHVIDKHAVEQVVAKLARIPDLHATTSEKERLRGLRSALSSTVFGQDNAIDVLVNAIQLSRAGLGAPGQPVGSFLFVGPTGVGKTEVARQLARALGIALHRFDMSEYMEKHAVSRLIGAPPGYVGFEQAGLLTNAIRKTPHAVLLLDEIEKAHIDLFNILLQVMDHATLTDNNGAEADFSNVILIMTSNAGARDIARKQVGFERSLDTSAPQKEIERLFSPEFRNRLTQIVTFNSLPPSVMLQVVEKFLAQLNDQLAQKHVRVEVCDDAKDWLARHGHDERLGARPLARVIQSSVRQPLAEQILFGTLQNGGVAKVGVDNDKLTFHYEPASPPDN